jgi:hypothetical protein
MPRHFDDIQLGSIELFCLAAARLRRRAFIDFLVEHLPR